MSKSHWEKENLWAEYLKENLPDEETSGSQIDQTTTDTRSTGDSEVSKVILPHPPSSIPDSIMAKTTAKKTTKKVSKKTSEKKSSAVSTPYKVPPRPSQGSGPPKPGTDYTQAEWKTIVQELEALGKIERKKGAPSLTAERKVFCDYYQRNYLTILKKGQALGIIEPSTPKKSKKKARQNKITPPPKLPVSKSPKKKKPTLAPPTVVQSKSSGPSAASKLTKDEHRELITLRKIVAQAVQDGTISVIDLINARL